jgi:NAD(P)-dependent dehydrogenase (short-subunit alcohol dehydrogenase family)
MSYAPFDLTGKAVLITGGNGGIGLGMAEALARAGADIVIWGTNEEKNNAAAATLSAAGPGKILAQRVDVSQETQVADAFGEAVSALGRIDTVFLNAGVGGGSKSFLDISSEMYRDVLKVNLDGAFFTAREACRHMKTRAERGDPGGSLVGVASLAAIEGAARNEHYAATKGGLVSMMKGIAVEFARYGVRANAILPGWIATDMTSFAQGKPAFEEHVISRVPAGRWGRPEDFGGIAVYLASDASAFHSGDTLIVDGGYAIF